MHLAKRLLDEQGKAPLAESAASPPFALLRNSPVRAMPFAGRAHAREALFPSLETTRSCLHALMRAGHPAKRCRPRAPSGDPALPSPKE
jgi:hypothetical protein